MPNDEYQNEQDCSQYTAAEHTSHLIDYRCDNTGCQSQCQKSGIRKYITEPASNIVELVSSQCQSQANVFLVSCCKEQKSQGSDDRQCFCQRIHERRKCYLCLCNGCKQTGWYQHQNQTDQKHIPEDYITDKACHIS